MSGTRMRTPPAGSARLGLESELDGSTPVDESSPRLVCISTDVYASAALQATVSTILPESRVEAADTSIVRGIPDADCVIVAVGALYSVGVALVRELRARGFARPIILVVESPTAVDDGELALLGVPWVLAEEALALQLPTALVALLDRELLLTGSAASAAISASLRRLQSRVAAGEIARGLQHKLNNPLAALLAEAQLLELETLAPEHHTSVRRMVELLRRVIDVSRSIEGLGGVAES